MVVSSKLRYLLQGLLCVTSIVAITSCTDSDKPIFATSKRDLAGEHAGPRRLPRDNPGAKILNAQLPANRRPIQSGGPVVPQFQPLAPQQGGMGGAMGYGQRPPSYAQPPMMGIPPQYGMPPAMQPYNDPYAIPQPQQRPFPVAPAMPESHGQSPYFPPVAPSAPAPSLQPHYSQPLPPVSPSARYEQPIPSVPEKDAPSIKNFFGVGNLFKREPEEVQAPVYQSPRPISAPVMAPAYIPPASKSKNEPHYNIQEDEQGLYITPGPPENDMPTMVLKEEMTAPAVELPSAPLPYSDYNNISPVIPHPEPTMVQPLKNSAQEDAPITPRVQEKAPVAPVNTTPTHPLPITPSFKDKHTTPAITPTAKSTEEETSEPSPVPTVKDTSPVIEVPDTILPWYDGEPKEGADIGIPSPVSFNSPLMQPITVAFGGKPFPSLHSVPPTPERFQRNSKEENEALIHQLEVDRETLQHQRDAVQSTSPTDDNVLPEEEKPSIL